MVSFPYHSHIFRDSYGSGMGLGILMGMVWEWYGKLTIRGSHYWGSLEPPLTICQKRCFEIPWAWQHRGTESLLSSKMPVLQLSTMDQKYCEDRRWEAQVKAIKSYWKLCIQKHAAGCHCKLNSGWTCWDLGVQVREHPCHIHYDGHWQQWYWHHLPGPGTRGNHPQRQDGQRMT